MKKPKNQSRIRHAISDDLDRLLRLEKIGFNSDRFEWEHIDELLHRKSATIFVIEAGDAIIGSAYILWQKRKGIARIYNIVIDPKFQRKGYGTILLKECEDEAVRRICQCVVLEVRFDNQSALRFYRKNGYIDTVIEPGFYEDGTSAQRMKKIMELPSPIRVHLDIDYYEQSLDFTCGAACLIMALRYFRPQESYTRLLEMKIWKEATQIFLASGIGGTDPFGLALAASRRGVSVRIISSTDKTPFIQSVRKKEKREAIQLLHEDMKKEALAGGVHTLFCDFGFNDLLSALRQGWIPITLISSYRFTGTREPHWIIVTGIDQHSVYIHDPYKHDFKGKAIGTQNGKLDRSEFQKMNRYGRDKYRCLILIGPPDTVS